MFDLLINVLRKYDFVRLYLQNITFAKEVM